MSMRLLPRQEIDRAKAREKELEVREGVKLATKVDDLRKLKTKEDEGLQKWRVETLKTIQEEIDSLAKYKNFLENEVKDKRNELFSLSAPLDKAWKFYVSSERAEISRLRGLANEELGSLQSKVMENDYIAETLKVKETKILHQQQEIASTRSETKKNLDQSLKVVEDARFNAQKLTDGAELIKKDAEKRQLSSKIREANVKLKEESLKRKEDDLEIREMEALSKELLYYSPVKKL